MTGSEIHLSRLPEQVAAGEEVANLVPHRTASVHFGGLKGELVYDDNEFGDVDQDIQHTFYGDAS